MTRLTHSTLHIRTLNLLPLQSALSAAERETPARPPCSPRDTDELLALRLIEKIRHPMPVSFKGVQIEPSQPLRETILELASAHA